MNFIERYQEIRQAQTNDHKCIGHKAPDGLAKLIGVSEISFCKLCGKVTDVREGS